MKVQLYNRENVYSYAKKWALKRNPKYYNFDSLGGDCTNFVSQCVYTGSGIMNFTKELGWYYRSLSDRAPAFTGVEYFYNFITQKKERIGPFGSLTLKENLKVGDIIQLGRGNGDFFHTLLVTENSNGNIFVSSHTRDFFNVPLEVYNFDLARFISIDGVYKP